MIDLNFLKGLRDKLKGGNARSIHLNVLPGRYATRLDFSSLNDIDSNLAQNFLNLLLTKANFEFKISFDGMDLNSLPAEEQKRLGLLSKRLNSLYIENEDNYKEQGIKTFGFGYPILIKRSKQDPKKIIKAPLFIWPLEIIKSYNKINTWSILRNKTRNESGRIVDLEIHSVNLNEVLLSFIKTDENIVIPQINEELLEDAIIDKNELITQCCKVLEAFNSNKLTVSHENLTTKFNEPIKNIPDASSIDSTIGNIPFIYFGGVFGLFRTQKESILSDLDKVIENYNQFKFENLLVEKFSETSYSAIDTDPSQQEIVSTLGNYPRKIIQGPPGTGKSQTLTALITNALANNLKCLVICEKKTALDVIKNNLHKENNQLGTLAAVIEDSNQDRDGIVNVVRDKISTLELSNYNPSSYQTIKQRMEDLVVEINQQHKKLDRKIYQAKSWTEVVGKFLKLEKIADYTLLKGRLNYKDFKFQEDENELNTINSKIKVAKKLYREVGRLEHPLEILNPHIFKEEDSYTVIQLRLEEFVKHLTNKVVTLKIDAEDDLKAYQQWLNTHYEGYYKNFKEQIGLYLSFITANQQQFGEMFLKHGSIYKIKINLFSIFSSKYSSLKANRALVITKISDLKQIQQAFKYVEHTFVETNQSNLTAYIENINNLNTAVEEWYKNISAVKQSYLYNFSSNNIHPQYVTNKAHIKITEDRYNSIITSIKREKLLKRELHDFSNYYIAIEDLYTLLTEIQIILKNHENFRDYYNWKKFYVELDPLHQHIVKSIIDCNCSDWEATFESWYYFWLLSINEDKQLPKDDDNIHEFIQVKEQLKDTQIKSIIINWENKQYNSIKSIQSRGIHVTSLYNKRGSRGEKRNSLRKIVKTDFELFTNFFPVLMVSPSVCSSIIPLKEGLFDLVIFDEASQLRLEDTFSSLLRGRIKIVSGDSQQMPPSSYFQSAHTLLNPIEEEYEDEPSHQEIETLRNSKNNALDLADSESLLSYAENCNYKQSYLKVHYRSKHPHLIDFSNHAFYGKRLIPMPARTDYKPIEFIEVNGLYEEQLNRDEAIQVVSILLHQIKPFNDGKYPSVGVATFNLYQRNLILEEITKARQSNSDYDKKISELGPDLFIKNLENIQGDERDIIILSTTFGKRTDGSFRQNFGPILQRNGYKLLNVIITRAKYKIYVCSSIPQEFIKQYPVLLQQQKNNGKAIFYAYLAYAKAISDGDQQIRETILKQLYENCEAKAFNTEFEYGSESVFEEEVYYRLAEKIGSQRLQQQYKIGGFRIDLVIKSEKTASPILAIECDGAKYHDSNEAYAWDVFRQKQIEQYGLTFYRIWSTNWWHSAEKEVKKLVEFIQNIEKEI